MAGVLLGSCNVGSSGNTPTINPGPTPCPHHHICIMPGSAHFPRAPHPGRCRVSPTHRAQAPCSGRRVCSQRPCSRVAPTPGIATATALGGLPQVTATVSQGTRTSTLELALVAPTIPPQSIVHHYLVSRTFRGSRRTCDNIRQTVDKP